MLVIKKLLSNLRGPSKKIGLILGLSNSLIFHSSLSFAGEYEQEIAKAMAETYAKEQIKFRAADYLNRNPQIVLSHNHQIGNVALKAFNDTLGVWNLVTAKTDKERLWAATYFVVPPEPTAAAILITAQFLDLYLSMESAGRIMKLDAETARIYRDAIKSVQTVADIQQEKILRVLERFETLLEEIESTQRLVLDHKLATYLMMGGEERPSTEEIKGALELTMALARQLEELQSLDYQLDGLWPEAGHHEAILAFHSANAEFNDLRRLSQSLTEAMDGYFASVAYHQAKATIDVDLRTYRTQLDTYRWCVKSVNRQSLVVARSPRKVSKGPEMDGETEAKFEEDASSTDDGQENASAATNTNGNADLNTNQNLDGNTDRKAILNSDLEIDKASNAEADELEPFSLDDCRVRFPILDLVLSQKLQGEKEKMREGKDQDFPATN